MKNILNIIVCAFAIFTVSSCGLFTDKNPSQDTENGAATVEGISQELKSKLEAQDTLMQTLVLTVDTLAQALKKVQNENIALENKVAKLESPKSMWGYMTFAAIALSILAVIVAFIRSKGITKEQAGEQIKHALDESKRINKLKEDVELLLSQRNRPANQSANYAPQYAEMRIRKIEDTLGQIVNVINATSLQTQQVSTQVNNPSVHSHKEPEYQKVGYARNDMDMYFTTIYDSNQEGCVFKITFTSLTEGKFDIISLDKIQSRNDWQQKIECSGDVSIKEASSYRVENEGNCKKIDENTWKVTKPLKIKLLK